MENFKSLSESEARLINGGTMASGLGFVGGCIAIFMAGWECGRGIAREVKSWF